MGLLDIDEYVRLPAELSLPGFLAALGDGVDQVLLPWVHFGGSEHDRRPDGLVIENYRHRVDRAHRQPKTIVRPAAVHAVGVHHCTTTTGRTVDAGGRPVREAWILDEPPQGDVWIAHYFTKSREEFARKIARGQADGGGGKTLADFARFNTPVEDDSIARRAPAVHWALTETAARPASPRVHAAWSAASELASCRAWFLAARAASRTLAQSPDARTELSPDRTVVVHPAGSPASPPDWRIAAEALGARLEAVPAGDVPAAPAGSAPAVTLPADAPHGLPFLVLDASTAAASRVTTTVHGRDAGGKRWTSTVDLPLPPGRSVTMAILSRRTLRIDAMLLTSAGPVTCHGGGLKTFV